MPDETRAELKRQWSEFIDELLAQTNWTMLDLAARVGCTVSCVSRWKSSDPQFGTIPTKATARVLQEIAEREGLT